MSSRCGPTSTAASRRARKSTSAHAGRAAARSRCRRSPRRRGGRRPSPHARARASSRRSGPHCAARERRPAGVGRAAPTGRRAASGRRRAGTRSTGTTGHTRSSRTGRARTPARRRRAPRGASCHGYGHAMARAVVTIYAGGTHEPFRGITLPALERFAALHGYDVIEAEPLSDPDLPVAWSKVARLRELLADHERVLWVDADLLIVDPRDDVVLPAWCFQGFAGDQRLMAGVCSALWVVLNRPEAAWFLREVWRLRHVDYGRAWEQGAVEAVLLREPDLSAATAALDDIGDAPPGRWLHADGSQGTCLGRSPGAAA